MTELTITPKISDKTARFKGTIAAGEHVAVTIKGGAEWMGTDDGANLTLRVIDLTTKRTLAVFPRPAETLEDGETVDAWSAATSDANDLYCELNLNTLRMVNAARHMLRVPVMFVLGDTDAPRTLYFCDQYIVEYWPERIGDDVPYDLDRWPRQIDEWTALVAEWTTQMTTFGATLSGHVENVGIHVTAAQKTAWTAKQDAIADLETIRAGAEKGATAIQEHQDISGKADLVGGKVPQSQLPSYVDDVLEYAAAANFPATGEEGKIYVAKDKNKTYRWSGTQYVQIGGSDIPIDAALSATSTNPVQNKVVKAAVDAKCTLAQAVAEVTRTATEWTYPTEVDGKFYAPSEEWILANGDTSRRYFELSEPSYDNGVWDSNVTFWYYDTDEGGWMEADSYVIGSGAASESATTITLQDPYPYAGDPMVDYVVTRTITNVHGLARLSDLSGKADKSEMSVTDGTGADADKTTIQLMSGTRATVLKSHQDISGKLGPYPFVTPTPSLEWGFSGTPASTGHHWDISYDAGWKLYSVSDVDPEESSFTDEASGTSSDTEVEFELVGVTATLGYVATLTPFTNAQIDMTSEDMAGITSFEVAVSASPVQGTMRDCILVIDCTSLTEGDEPTVTWDTHYHPRTDTATDMAIVEAGKVAVFYISEYMSGQFAVGGWQVTEGGNTPSAGGGE